ncbi:MAG: hypothetical protein ACLQKA_20050 [Bryobacteraceae bacterium]
MIELEDRRSEALKSSRKYLPEDSRAILRGLGEYLQRKISECRSTADPRKSALADLDMVLRQDIPVTVKTAGALRSSTWVEKMEEELTLVDQPGSGQPRLVQADGDREDAEQDGPADILKGTCNLDGARAKALRRCVIILDAVIRQHDHSSATCHSWLQKAPLKALLKQKAGEHPKLQRFIFPREPASGITLDFEALLPELVAIWSDALPAANQELARRLISDYFPKALGIRPRETMDHVLSAASSQVQLPSAGLP